MITITGTVGSVRHRLLLLVDSLSTADRVMLTEALAVAEAAHISQLRKPGREADVQPYILHPMRVALIIIEELGLKDPAALAAALLHDVIEESGGKLTIRDIEVKFGRLIALMVSILTKPHRDDSISREQQLTIYYERIAGAGLPTRIVKLADRLDNMRDAIECGEPEFQSSYLKETRKIFLPSAEATDEYLHEELINACEQLEYALTEGVFEPLP